MIRFLRYILVTLLSLGWLAPFVFAVTWTNRGAELIAAGALGDHSFPYFEAARQAAYVSAAWAVAAGAAWIAIWYRR